jgi:hypothetical protein
MDSLNIVIILPYPLAIRKYLVMLNGGLVSVILLYVKIYG